MHDSSKRDAGLGLQNTTPLYEAITSHSRLLPSALICRGHENEVVSTSYQWLSLKVVLKDWSFSCIFSSLSLLLYILLLPASMFLLPLSPFPPTLLCSSYFFHFCPLLPPPSSFSYPFLFWFCLLLLFLPSLTHFSHSSISLLRLLLWILLLPPIVFAQWLSEAGRKVTCPCRITINTYRSKNKFNISLFIKELGPMSPIYVQISIPKNCFNFSNSRSNFQCSKLNLFPNLSCLV